MQKIKEHYHKITDDHSEFDLVYWQAQGPKAIFKAAEDLIKDYFYQMGKAPLRVDVLMSAAGIAFEESIRDRIYSIRGFQVMLGSDLAELYGVETKRLNEAVRRNKDLTG